MKKLLIIGGKPAASCDIVNYAKSEGVYTIVTDYLPEEESPAKKIADDSWDISTSNIETLAKRIKTEKIDAVFTGVHEFNILKTAELCEKTGLPFYADGRQLKMTMEKHRYKRLFKDFGVPVVPEYQIDKTFGKNSLNSIEYPVVLKPVDGSGGYGISICEDKNELTNNYSKAIQYSSSKKVLLEKHIKTGEMAIFYIIQNGNIRLSVIADRYVADINKSIIPLPVAYIFPSKHTGAYISSLNDKVKAALGSLELKNGTAFIQSFIEDGKFMFYDMGFRLSATQEYNILEKTCGYNPLKMMVDYSLTGKMGKEDISSKISPYINGKHACNITYLCKPCTIGKILGIEEVRKINGVLSAVPNHLEGETIPETARGTLNQVILRVFAEAGSKTELSEIIKKANSLVKVYSDTNEDVLFPVSDLVAP